MNEPLRARPWNEYEAPHRDLREALERIERAGELKTVRGADWNLELGALAEIAYRRPNPPAILYEQIAKDGQDGGRSKPPWSEVVVFSFLGFGFWIAYASAEANAKTAFLIVAASMTVTALGCLALAIMRPRGRDKDDDAA